MAGELDLNKKRKKSRIQNELLFFINRRNMFNPKGKKTQHGVLLTGFLGFEHTQFHMKL